jgi:DNA-binding TFAR19-related protein (PDSD5 family)
MSLPNIDMEALQQKAQVEQAQKQQKEQVEERRNFILSQILEPAAEERMKRWGLRPHPLHPLHPLRVIKATNSLKL